MVSYWVFSILWLFMHLLCTIVCYDISNNHTTPSWIHAHHLVFTWQVFRVKDILTDVSYIVFPIFLSHLWAHTFV